MSLPPTKTAGTLRPMRRLAIPVLVEQLLAMLIGFSDMVFAGWGLGARGAWYATAADLTIRAARCVYRFRHGGWKRIEV